MLIDANVCQHMHVGKEQNYIQQRQRGNQAVCKRQMYDAERKEVQGKLECEQRTREKHNEELVPSPLINLFQSTLEFYLT